MEAAFDDFCNFLILKHIVDGADESKATCHVYRVHWRPKGSRKRFGDELTSADKDRYLRKLSKTKEHWQVDQAALSIRIYQYFIKTRKSADHAASIYDIQKWQFLANEIKSMLRLKQRAISPERACLLWLRRFYRFVLGRSPFTLDSSHVKNFLTHQAVDHKVAKSNQDQAFNALLFFSAM